MSEKIDIDDPTITHMLGYLSAHQWADAIRNKSVDKDKAMKLLDIQQNKYGGIRPDVEELLSLSKEGYLKAMKEASG